MRLEEFIQILEEKWNDVKTIEDREKFIKFYDEFDAKLRRRGLVDVANQLQLKCAELLETPKNKRLLIMSRLREIRYRLREIELEVGEYKEKIKKVRKEMEELIKPLKERERRLIDECAELISERFRLLAEQRELEERLRDLEGVEER